MGIKTERQQSDTDTQRIWDSAPDPRPPTAPRWRSYPQVLSRLERLAPAILAALIIMWVAIIFAGSVYKYETFGQGYDQVDFEQAIWNTVQGHPMEDSRFSFTDSVFGMDWMPMLMLFVPFYAVIQSPHTLFFIQIMGAGLGAVPLYWLARD